MPRKIKNTIKMVYKDEILYICSNEDSSGYKLTKQDVIDGVAHALFDYVWGGSQKYTEQDKEVYGELAKVAFETIF